MTHPIGHCQTCLPKQITHGHVSPLALGDAVDIPLAIEFDSTAPAASAVRFYWLSVILVMGESLVTDVEGVRDIQFGVIWREPSTVAVVDGPSFDRNLSARILTREQRAHVRNLLCDAVRCLLDWCVPNEVTMSTVDTDLDVPALRKFVDIAAACEAAGWSCIEQFRDGDGRDHWHFRAKS